MSDTSGEAMCYVGKAPCGCYLYAAVIEAVPRVEHAKDIQRMILDGWTIEQKPCQWVRDGGLNFDCTHRAKSPRVDRQEKLQMKLAGMSVGAS